ncbi:phosphopantetheine-binding protein [Lysinibacillus sp. MHQ-1]|nr:phosphopantetheine-binding protein [Lysinibacillus sp. MHQ-1]
MLKIHLGSQRLNWKKSIVEVWAEVLKVNEIGIDDNFFEIGGDSIKSLQIVSKLRTNGIDITPKDFFEAPYGIRDVSHT